MKRNTLQLLILISSMSFLQSCISPFQWGAYDYGHTTVNTEKFKKSIDSEKDQAFGMYEAIAQPPLMSEKGETNLNFNICHGVGLSFSTAISRKLFIEGGYSHSKQDDVTTQSAKVEATYFPWGGGTPNTYSVITGYDKSRNFNSNSFYIGVGAYKTFAGNGRWDYHGGFTYGKGTTVYTYDFDLSDNPFSFTENRKFMEVFLQSDFGYVTKRTEAAIIARTSWLRFSNQEFEKYSGVDTYEMQKDEFVFQPAIHFAYGGGFRVYSQVGWNVALGNSQLNWFPTNVQVGILLRLKEQEK